MGGPMNPTVRDGARSIPFAVTDPGFIPKERYLDSDFAALERERLWPRVWQVACREEEIPRPGDYSEYVIDDQSILLVRTDTGVKGYFNACRHRATELAKGSGTFTGGQIVCPFHGWRWNLEGANRFVFGGNDFRDDLLAADELCLRECGVDTWGGCVWLNLDPQAPPLAAALDPLPALLDPLGIDRMRVRWWKSVALGANWKLAQEAFMEGYHVMQTHPQLTLGRPQDADPDDLEYLTHPGGHSHFQNRIRRSRGAAPPDIEAIIESSRLLWTGLDAMTLERDFRAIEALRHIPVAAGGSVGAALVNSVYERAAAEGVQLPAPDRHAIGRWGGMFFAFPNFFVLPQYGNALSYRCRPFDDNPEKCLFEVWSLTLYPEGQDPGRATLSGRFDQADQENWGLIPRQDFSNMERQQRGVHSDSFTHMRLATEWEGAIANLHYEVDRYIER